MPKFCRNGLSTKVCGKDRLRNKALSWLSNSWQSSELLRDTDQGWIIKAQATDQGGVTKAPATDQGRVTKARATHQRGMTKARATHQRDD